MIHNFIQGSEEWREYKRGKISASRIIDIMPGTKGSYLASRKNYMSELICEILTDTNTEHFTSAAMEHGTETEPIARSTYEAINGVIVDEVGFIDHPNISGCGASPDGLVSDKGCIEIKCPNTATHIDTLINDNVKRNYIYQMQFVMSCGGREWCDFISFDNRLPDNLSIYIKRFNRDEKLITEIDKEIVKFQGEMNELIEKLRSLS